MLRRTQKKIIYTFGAILLIAIAYSLFQIYDQPTFIAKNNLFLKDISVYQSRAKEGEKPKVQFSLSWKKQLKKSLAENKDNFVVEQVIPNGRSWSPVINGKKCTVDFIQYVYAPWVDSEEKRKKADPDKRDDKVTQIFVNITPEEEINDYYRVTVKNIESSDGEKLETQEEGVVLLNEFNKFIKR